MEKIQKKVFIVLCWTHFFTSPKTGKLFSVEELGTIFFNNTFFFLWGDQYNVVQKPSTIQFVSFIQLKACNKKIISYIASHNNKRQQQLNINHQQLFRPIKNSQVYFFSFFAAEAIKRGKPTSKWSCLWWLNKLHVLNPLEFNEFMTCFGIWQGP